MADALFPFFWFNIYTKYDSQTNNTSCVPIIYHLYYKIETMYIACTHTHTIYNKHGFVHDMCLFVCCTFVIQNEWMTLVPSFLICAVCMTRYSMVLVAQLTHFRFVKSALSLSHYFYHDCFVSLAFISSVCTFFLCGKSIINKDIPCIYCKCHRQSAKTFAKMYTFTIKTYLSFYLSIQKWNTDRNILVMMCNPVTSWIFHTFVHMHTITHKSILIPQSNENNATIYSIDYLQQQRIIVWIGTLIVRVFCQFDQ